MFKLFSIAAISFLFYSCMKVPIPVIDNASTSDPNISFFDNYTVALETYKLDSFLTSGSGTFAAGFHKDPLFGVINASAYVQVELPSDNPIKDKNVSFDSLEIILTPNGNYYGDTLAPYKIEAYKLLEKIENEDAIDNHFYNPRNFSYDPALLGSNISVIRPKRGTNIKIRLSDNMGLDLLTKLKNNHTDIQDNKSFINYFKGLYFKADTSLSRTVYYFKPHLTNSIMRLHYHLNGVFSEEKVLDFPISNAKQFNSIHITTVRLN